MNSRRHSGAQWLGRGARGRKNGFTLLEVLVSLAILAIAVTVILQIFSSGLRTLAVSGDREAAVSRADARLREILQQKDLAEKSWREVSAEGYPLEIKVSEALSDRTAGLPLKALAVDLTIRWRQGLGEKSFTIRTIKTVAGQDRL